MRPALGKPSQGSSLQLQIYQKLRDDIITGEIATGVRLLETGLAAELGVSRTPVREALQRLASEGLLAYIPRAGYVVEEMSVHDIEDLFSTRTEIEQVAVRWAIVHIKPEELDQLAWNIRKTEEILAKGQTDAMIELDSDFHQVIYRAARNKTLYKITQMLSDHTLKFRIACIHLADVARRARSGHVRIYRAIRDRDPQAAEAAARDHLEQVKKDILACLKRLRREAMFD